MSVRREVVLPVDPPELWPAVTEAEELSEWFGARVDRDLEPGAVVRFTGDEERVAVVGGVEPGRRLSWDWWPADGTAPPSHVEVVLEPVEDGTRLVVTETGPVSPEAGARFGGLPFRLEARARAAVRA